MHGKRTHFKNRVYKAEVIAKSGFWNGTTPSRT